jgi:hypothetical protein
MWSMTLSQTDEFLPSLNFSIAATFVIVLFVFLIGETEMTKSVPSFSNLFLLPDAHTCNQFILTSWSRIFGEKHQFLLFPLRFSIIYTWLPSLRGEPTASRSRYCFVIDVISWLLRNDHWINERLKISSERGILPSQNWGELVWLPWSHP